MPGLPVWSISFDSVERERRFLLPRLQNMVRVTWPLLQRPSPLELTTRVHFRRHDAPVAGRPAVPYALTIIGDRSELAGHERDPHLSEACIGSISETPDATDPFAPRGSIAQAWSVAEVLRCRTRTATPSFVRLPMRGSLIRGPAPTLTGVPRVPRCDFRPPRRDLLPVRDHDGEEAMRRALPFALSVLLLGCAARNSTPTTVGSPAIPEHPACAQASAADAPAVIEQDFPGEDGSYVGGTVHLALDAPVGDVARVLSDPESYRWFLPRVLELESLGQDGPDSLVEVEHGISMVRGRYTMRVRSEADPRSGSHLFRFWVDRRYEHAVRDAWGWFLLWPCGEDKTLLAYHIRIDLGPGIVRMLFQERIRRAALSAPQKLAALVSDRQRHEQADAARR